MGGVAAVGVAGESFGAGRFQIAVGDDRAFERNADLAPVRVPGDDEVHPVGGHGVEEAQVGGVGDTDVEVGVVGGPRDERVVV